ncbi:MAG: DUF4860 domain-containing protein [Oscillospiraceae bacterium]|nr:DUF4860 domain-containing protein [Oscillospiraceae bacterium]
MTGKLYSNFRIQNSGFSVIELLVALTLLALFGGAIMTIIGAGSSVYQRIIGDKEADSEARIAMSYISVKLRQNDRSGAISIVDSDLKNDVRKVLKIDLTPEDVNDDCHFIFFEENENGQGGRLIERVSNVPGVGGTRASGWATEYGVAGGAPHDGEAINGARGSGVANGGVMPDGEASSTPGIGAPGNSGGAPGSGSGGDPPDGNAFSVFEARQTEGNIAPGSGALYSDATNSSVIADIYDFSISYRDGREDLLDIEVMYLSGNREKSLKTTIMIKSNRF